jgi:hypothetical protein
MIRKSQIAFSGGDYFTIKVGIKIPQESKRPIVLMLSIPTSYTVREAVLHSLEYFNGKLRKHRLRMNPDIYSFMVESSATEGSELSTTSKSLVR